MKCLKENEECKDYNFPYYNNITRECLKDLSECPSTTKKFNNVCYEKCPINTKEIDNSICICNISEGK